MDTITMLSREFLKRHPLDAARMLERQQTEDCASFLEESSAPLVAQVFTIMDTVAAEQCLEHMSDERCADIISELTLEVAALYVRGMAKARKEAIVNLMPSELGDALRKILHYPAGTVGSVMDPFVVTVPEDLSVKELLKRFRNMGHHILDYVYVIDRENKLIGHVTLRDLMVADQRSLISNVLRKNNVTVFPTSTIKSVGNHPVWSEVRALPVVDDKGVFLGAIEHRTLRRLAVKELDRKDEDAVRSAGSALGELFWIGMSGLFSGAMYAVKRED